MPSTLISFYHNTLWLMDSVEMDYIPHTQHSTGMSIISRVLITYACSYQAFSLHITIMVFDSTVCLPFLLNWLICTCTRLRHSSLVSILRSLGEKHVRSYFSSSYDLQQGIFDLWHVSNVSWGWICSGNDAEWMSWNWNVHIMDDSWKLIFQAWDITLKLIHTLMEKCRYSEIGQA